MKTDRQAHFSARETLEMDTFPRLLLTSRRSLRAPKKRRHLRLHTHCNYTCTDRQTATRDSLHLSAYLKCSSYIFLFHVRLSERYTVSTERGASSTSSHRAFKPHEQSGLRMTLTQSCITICDTSASNEREREK